jgi:hypothetical protein
MQHKREIRNLLMILVMAGWFAIGAQFYLIIENRTASIGETIIRYFSFFTVLTNILVAICCTAILFFGNSTLAKFFSKQNTLTAIAVYITVVGIIYNSILRFLWNPQGLQWIVDELLHTAIPILFIILWLFFIPKIKLKWKSVLAWLLYPLIYLVFILARGSFSAFYPYPFIDVSKLGYEKTFIHSAGMLVVFILISLLYIVTGRYLRKKNFIN